MSTVTSGSRAPWWLWPLVIGGFFAFPGLYLGCAESSAEKVRTEFEERELGSDSSDDQDEYVPPCDTDAVLEALGLTAIEYQAARGLYVDGWVGPQTAAALCAEEIEPPATIPEGMG